MKKLSNFISPFSLFIAMSSLSLANSANAEYQAPPAQVAVVKAEKRFMAPTSIASGSVVSINDAQISSQLTGELIWLAEVGSKVAKGQTIAEIDATRYRLAVETADSQIKALQADLEFRNQEVKRLKKLAIQNNTSKAKLQEETAKQAMLVEQIRAAKAALAEAKYDLSLTKISAPFNGAISKRYTSKGEFLMAGSPLLQLVDITQPEISVNVPIDLLPFLKVGDSLKAESKLVSEQVKLKAVVPVGDSVSRMINLRLTPTAKNWIIGASVQVAVPSAIAAERVSIPRDSLIIKGTDVYVFRVSESMVAERISAQIIAADGRFVSIASELNEGDAIIIRGGERLMPGQSVQFLSDDPQQAQAPKGG